MTAGGAPKRKTDRKLVGWAFALSMAGLVIYLLMAKGTDLGQGEVQAKKAAAEQKAVAQRYAVKIDDPARASETQFAQAQEKIKREEEARHPVAPLVPPPPMGPDDMAGAIAPPPPTGVDGAAGHVELDRLERARREVDTNPSAVAGAPAAPGFVMYQAAPDKKSGSLMTAPLHALDATSGEQDSEDGQIDPESDPRYKAAMAQMDAAKARQAAVEKAAEEKVSQPGDENNRWLNHLQNDQVKPASAIVATRATGLYWLAPGTAINAVILNAVDTRLPGRVAARVTQTTYDSRYGRYVVIPAGSILQGQYNSDIKDGQKRVMMAFDTLVTPGGGQVALGSMTAADALGRAGLAGDLHTHFLGRMGIATLMAIEAVGMDRLSKQTQVVAGGGMSGPSQGVSSGGQIMVDAANEELKRRFALGPNITMDAGQPMTIITTGGIEIPPIANAR